jgi:MFS family permease
MEEDLELVGNQYQAAVSLVFVTYVICETPSNMVLKRFTPRLWIGFIATLWGIISALTGLVNNFGQLVACRLLLGAVEAGLFPGMTIYLTFFYTKKELGVRVGYLLVSAALAGGVGGLLAFGIGLMDGIAGLHGWRWIMIIEGLPGFFLGITTFFLMPNDPETAYFLNDTEKALVQARRNAEYGQTASAQLFNKKDAWMAAKDWKVWLISSGHFGIDTMLYGMALPLSPQFYANLGHRFLNLPSNYYHRNGALDTGPSPIIDHPVLLYRSNYLYGHLILV